MTSTVSTRRKLVSGGISGSLSCTLLAPVERVRTLMMTNETPLSLTSACRKVMSHASGPRASLWMGNGLACAKIAPKAGIMLYSFDTLKTRIAKDPTNVTPLERFVAGGCAGIISELFIYPMSVTRTRLATGMYQGVQDCVGLTYREGGIRAFYRGLMPSVAGIVPYAGIDLAVNSMLKDQARKVLHGSSSDSQQPLPIPMMLACGAGSSATSSILTFPTLVIRTKAQATGLPVTAVVNILSKEGTRGFYRGLVPSLMRVMPGAAVTYTTYDLLNRASR